ncbi:cysteinyl-tRNA synthetase, unknown class [Tenacibaculum sp. MAR_2009_124]|uniref:endo alpha-1,4 polygalactosaminidase n=1 Tax=Tenacibaculum sp. MAR_2009_124 TaxID=1250059 RepID=UPI000897F7DA|nr:endo alpha-1,4 polygalactosaminidase [Tenacibaculum sp. MAR_2009_124]SED14685.1 cysteinyl-tRNA synthetase, unknown class [Tenacibaculum sp. MAR_2009_124]
MSNKNYLLILVMSIVIESCSKIEMKSPENREDSMREFVVQISQYAKRLKSDFIIIPQNGIELAYTEYHSASTFSTEFTNAIDGFGIEALFYDSDELPIYDRLTMLQKFSENKQVLVSDYLSDDALLEEVIYKNAREGFLSFPRMSFNYDYTHIPNTIQNENSENILTLNDAKNYLYLINASNFSTKQELIDNLTTTNFDVILIDLFFHGRALTREDLQKIKVKENGGKRLVISYVNIGSAEKYRYYFNNNWEVSNPHWLAKPYKGYENEIFVKYWSNEWHSIIYGNDDSYLKKIIDAGFDGAYLDNVKSYHYLFSDEF